jgi:hypothetical protein
MQRRRSTPHTFDQRLSAEKARIEAELEKENPGPRRDQLERKLRQMDVAFRVDSWASSKGLQPPS